MAETKTTFTPGTLTVRDYPPGRAFASQIFSLNGLLVAHTYGPDHAALGKLFAAAPDLYAAGEAICAAAAEVEAMLDAGEPAPDDSAMWEAISKMRAALARANGEG